MASSLTKNKKRITRSLTSFAALTGLSRQGASAGYNGVKRKKYQAVYRYLEAAMFYSIKAIFHRNKTIKGYFKHFTKQATLLENGSYASSRKATSTSLKATLS